MKSIRLLPLLVMLLLNSLSAQKPDPQLEAIKKHYEFLESETKTQRETMRQENETYRKFIQEERSAHQAFLERNYMMAIGIIGICSAIFAFFGWDTFKGIKNSRKEVETAAAKQILEYSASMEQHKIKAEAAAASFEQYTALFRQTDPSSGRYLLVSEVNAPKKDDTKKDILSIFEKVFGAIDYFFTPDTFKNAGTYDIATFDVVIYLYEKGQDLSVSTILEKLKQMPVKIPFVIYTGGIHLSPEIMVKLNEYGLFNLATSQVTLIDNISTTYRVSKLMKNTHNA